MNDPMGRVYKNVIIQNQIAFGRFWVKEPRHSENIVAEMRHLYRKTHPLLRLNGTRVVHVFQVWLFQPVSRASSHGTHGVA